MKTLFLSSLLCLTMPLYAAAGETSWLETDGGNVRLVVAPIAQGEETLRGFIDIDLLPGWKTYWANPGSGGIPPSIEVNGGANAVISYPAPIWINTQYGAYAGYDAPVELPFEIDLNELQSKDQIDVRLMVGICEDICIPAFTNFSLPVEQAIGNGTSSIAVMKANAQLPRSPETLGLEITNLTSNAEGVELDITGKEKIAALFAAGSGAAQLSKPEIIEQSAEATRYAIKFLRPIEASKPITITIAGKTSAGAFEFDQELTILPSE